ncbi:hypothetical protein F2981_07040 [Sinorhizobium meliloti]|nr:hypothetical protein [Sinorhizobium meliloti]
MFLIDMFNKKTILPDAATALPGREEEIPTATTHFVSGRPLKGPYPEGMKKILFGMGCFWAPSVSVGDPRRLRDGCRTPAGSRPSPDLSGDERRG